MADQKIKITISAAAKGLQAEFSKAGKALKAFKGEMGMTQKAAVSLSSSLKAALGGVGLGLVTRELFRAGVEAQQLRTAFASVAGSAPAAAAELDFIRAEADRLGQEFYSVADAYKGIFAAAKGTKLEGQGVRDLFVSISEAGTALSTNGEALNRVFLQLSQGIGRGKFELEDLKTISEAMPGIGMQDFAKALGVTAAQFMEMVSKGKVVSDQFLPKLSAALHEKFGEAAAAAGDTAIAAFNRFITAWTDIKVAVAESGFLKVATNYLTALAIAMKDPAVKEAIKQWASRFFELADATAKWVFEHKEVLASLAAAAIVIPKIVAAWKGLNAAMLELTALRMGPWLATVNLGLSGMVGTTLTLAGAFATAAAAAAALFAGYKLGEWLTMRDAVKGIAEETKILNRATAATSARFLEISRDTGVAVTSMEELDKAVAEGIIHFDEMTAEWKAGAAEQADAVKASAATQQQVTGKALDEMKKKYKEYADKVKRLQDQIAGREQSLQEKLRAMGRTGMSELGAWRDRKREADEYYTAAQRAAGAGNFDEAVQLADKAQAAYEDLNKEVKDGEKVQISQSAALKKSMKGVEAAGRLAIDALTKQKKAAAEAADALNQQSGGLLDPASYRGAQDAVADLQRAIDESGGDWGRVWDQMEQDAKGAIDASEQRIVKLTKDRNITVYINEVVKKAMGGPVGRFATGGKLPGYGGGDRIPALLEAGEYIIRKEAVSRFGSGIFHMLNSLRLPKFAAGGAVSGPAAAAAGDTVNVNFTFPSGRTVGPFRGTRAAIRELDRERRHMALGGSGV